MKQLLALVCSVLVLAACSSPPASEPAPLTSLHPSTALSSTMPKPQPLRTTNVLTKAGFKLVPEEKSDVQERWLRNEDNIGYMSIHLRSFAGDYILEFASFAPKEGVRNIDDDAAGINISWNLFYCESGVAFARQADHEIIGFVEGAITKVRRGMDRLAQTRAPRFGSKTDGKVEFLDYRGCGLHVVE